MNSRLHDRGACDPNALAAGAVHVWHADPTSLSQDDLTRLWQVLAADERESNGTFRSSERRLDHLVGRALVRSTLSRYATVAPHDWVFATGQFGRPEIAAPAGVPPLRFSLSHTRGLVAVAVALDADIGLDVAYLDERTDTDVIARRYFAAAEAADLESCPAPERRRRFFQYWTLKEALVKATGLGFSMPFDSFTMTLSSPPAVSFADHRRGDGAEWQFSPLRLTDSHVAAVAVRSSGTPLGALTCFPWRAGPFT